MFDHGRDRGNLDPVTLQAQAQLQIPHELVKIVALEVRRELLEEGLDVGQVDQAVLLAKLQLEEVLDEGERIHVSIVHVAFHGVREVAARDVPRVAPTAVSTGLGAISIPVVVLVGRCTLI